MTRIARVRLEHLDAKQKSRIYQHGGEAFLQAAIEIAHFTRRIGSNLDEHSTLIRRHRPSEKESTYSGQELARTSIVWCGVIRWSAL